LAPNPDDRYGSAAEMQMDLEGYLAARGLVISPRAVGDFVTQSCAEARRKVLADIRGQLSAHGLSWTDSGDGLVSHRIRPKLSSHAAAMREHEHEHEAERESQPDTASGERVFALVNRTQRTPSQEVPSEASAPEAAELLVGNGSSDGAPLRLFGGATPMARGVVAIAGFGTVAVLVFALGLGAPRPTPGSSPGAPAPTPGTASATAAKADTAALPPASSRIRIVASAQPKDAKWYLDGVEMGSNPLQTSAARDLQSHTLRAEAKGFEPFVKTFLFDANIDVTVVLAPK
jgi:hypothetical protein